MRTPRNSGPDAGRVLPGPDLSPLVDALVARGYQVIAPTLLDGAISYREISSAAELPYGWTDRQDAGTYRVQRRADSAAFGHVVGPGSLKQFLFPPHSQLWRSRRPEGASDTGADFQPEEPDRTRPRYAFLGVRSCDLAAVAVQDRVFLDARHPDPEYAARTAGSFVVAVSCGEPAPSCFCTSMGTGPTPQSCSVGDRPVAFDLSLTELLGHPGPADHSFLAVAGSDRGAQLLATLPGREATDADHAAAARQEDTARAAMVRSLDTSLLPGLLTANPEHPRWNDVGERCLGCTNCTMVCPTCFCSSVEDVTDLDGSLARERSWDSCFTTDFGYIHGGSVRTSSRARYRQWLTHKMDTWHAQFGTSGCVGCGRCIVWCPVGIDVTEEVAAIAATAEDAP